MKNSRKIRRDFKRVFLKKGTCSRTFFYLLNREFGFPLEEEEQASDPLAGGILQQGYQCGMLWGASLALGAEAFRRFKDRHRAIGMTIKATQHLMRSFISRAESMDCSEITNCDFSSKFNLAKFFFTGKFWACFKLADKWAPEAFQSAAEGLDLQPAELPKHPLSCASEVVGRMGGTDREMVMVAGFAGGLGLSGDGCGALCAAIWKNALHRVRHQNWKFSLSDPVTEKILKQFYETTDYEMECSEISGREFRSIDDHTEFIRHGGCQELIKMLTGTHSIQ